MRAAFLGSNKVAAAKDICELERQIANVRPRLKSVDFLRGLAIVLMVLDHVRHFFYYNAFDPLNLEKTNAVLFFTRWVPDFAATTFFLTAGIGAYLYCARGKTKVQLARFLLIRGLWLIVLELTVLRIVWLGLNFDYHYMAVQVLWALGWSMIILAGLLFLPTLVIAILGSLMIATHNLLDHISVTDSSVLHCLWSILHVPGDCEYAPGFRVGVWYPLVPWIGVMAVGYAVGALLVLPWKQRSKWLQRLGIGLIAAFVIIRANNGYGDPQPWSAGRTGFFTLLSFLSTEKYPPSLLFLLMTLGPAFWVLSLAERDTSVLSRPFIVFGRVPLFAYLTHLLLIKLIVVFISHGWDTVSHSIDRFRLGLRGLPPPLVDVDFRGYNVAVVYVLWLCLLVMLFPLCRWFMDIKSRKRSPWLSYL